MNTTVIAHVIRSSPGVTSSKPSNQPREYEQPRAPRRPACTCRSPPPERAHPAAAHPCGSQTPAPRGADAPCATSSCTQHRRTSPSGAFAKTPRHTASNFCSSRVEQLPRITLCSRSRKIATRKRVRTERWQRMRRKHVRKMVEVLRDHGFGTTPPLSNSPASSRRSSSLAPAASPWRCRLEPKVDRSRLRLEIQR